MRELLALAVIVSPIVVGNVWLLAARFVRRPKTGGTDHA